jgi:hypothetical protein
MVTSGKRQLQLRRVTFLMGQICFLYRVILETKRPYHTVKVKAVLSSVKKSIYQKDSNLHSLCCEKFKPIKGKN